MVENMANNNLDRNKLKQLIQDEFNVSASRAKFIARQESTLFFSEQRNHQYTEAGYKFYFWKATDFSARTRPYHKALDSKTSKQFYDVTNPPIDTENGHRHNPGENYNCRCTAIFLNDAEVENYKAAGYKLAFGPKITPAKK
jgi:SPP1 gp7 family putative phage head morphogenesis protein